MRNVPLRTVRVFTITSAWHLFSCVVFTNECSSQALHVIPQRFFLQASSSVCARTFVAEMMNESPNDLPTGDIFAIRGRHDGASEQALFKPRPSSTDHRGRLRQAALQLGEDPSRLDAAGSRRDFEATIGDALHNLFEKTSWDQTRRARVTARAQHPGRTSVTRPGRFRRSWGRPVAMWRRKGIPSRRHTFRRSGG